VTSGAGSKLRRSQRCLGRREPGFQSKVPLINQGVVNARRHMAAATTSKPERPHPLQISVISIMALQITVVLGEQDQVLRTYDHPDADYLTIHQRVRVEIVEISV
jgi:hypothetical protein